MTGRVIHNLFTMRALLVATHQISSPISQIARFFRFLRAEF